MLAASPALREALQKVTTIAQATLLVPRPAAAAAGALPLCVVNTHLFFHPYAPHIRTMHTAAILDEANAFIEAALRGSGDRVSVASTSSSASASGSVNGGDDAAAAGGAMAAAAAALAGRRPALVFCGDLNSDLNDGRLPGAIELLQAGQLAPGHWDWARGASFSWGAVSTLRTHMYAGFLV